MIDLYDRSVWMSTDLSVSVVWTVHFDCFYIWSLLYVPPIELNWTNSSICFICVRWGCGLSPMCTNAYSGVSVSLRFQYGLTQINTLFASVSRSASGITKCFRQILPVETAVPYYSSGIWHFTDLNFRIIWFVHVTPGCKPIHRA